MQWAVLIGVDFYVDDPCLKGSVQDVSMIHSNLQLADPPVDIALLTASTPPDPNSGMPQEPSEKRATRENVVLALKRILCDSREGDFVYFHYSGHGVRLQQPQPGEYEHVHGNLALCLFCNDPPYSSYLKGRNLGNCFQQMVEKGLRVTIVLDCCHSGSVLRGDALECSIREVPYSPAVEAAHPSSQVDSIFPHSDIRRSSLSTNQWLINPNGYVILAACGPHETAQEIKSRSTDQPTYHGALSYFLMKALAFLSTSNKDFNPRSLYGYLRTMFRAHWPQQTPMMYGKSEHNIFGKPGTMAIRAALLRHQRTYVRWWRDDQGQWRLQLDAGEAHCVEVGDEYELHPSSFVDRATSHSGGAPAIVTVVSARPFTSILAAMEPACDLSKIEDGWLAVERSSVRHRRIPVRFMPRAASLLHHTRSKSTTTPGRFLLAEDCIGNTVPPNCIFHVDLNDIENSYQILDGHLNKIPSLPAIALNKCADERLWNILDHITTFKFLEQVEKAPGPELQDHFEIRTAIGTPDNVGDASCLNVQHEQSLIFSVKNLKEQPLYLALFNFTSTWGVSNLLWDSGSGEFHVLQPRMPKSESEERIELTMTIPKSSLDQGQRGCEEILKFFVMTTPTAFPGMMLPDIADSLLQHRRTGESEIETRLNKTWDILQRLGNSRASLRGESPVSRPERWATKSFIVRIRKGTTPSETFLQAKQGMIQ